MKLLVLTPAMVEHTPDLRTAGTYLLHLWLNHQLTQIAIGRLGRFDFAPGHYYYVGSAFGTGGLAARLRRHIAIEKRFHWHIDYLRPHAEIRTIWAAPGRDRLECRWCKELAKVPELIRPISGFGASDTGCGGHLFFAATAIAESSIRELLLTG